MILITSTISGVCSGILADKISRIFTMSLGAAIFCAGSVIECVSLDLVCILVGRGIAGVGEGFFLPIIAVYWCVCLSIFALRSGSSDII